MTMTCGARDRGILLVAALAATVPVWPGVQPGSPIRDEMLAPGEVVVLVPVVLIFPIAWALLAQDRRTGRGVGLLLAGLVAAWSVGTVRFAAYGWQPTVDDFLRGYLITAGLVVLGAAAGTLTGVRKTGVGIWILGVVAAVAVPVVGAVPEPPGVSLPSGIRAEQDRLDCNRACTRVITVRASGTDQARALTRRIGEHLATAEGWRMRWYEFAVEPDVECRPPRRMTDPYQLCLWLRSVGDPDARVEIRLGYSNRYDPVYRSAS
jgi:hypothetical protein